MENAPFQNYLSIHIWKCFFLVSYNYLIIFLLYSKWKTDKKQNISKHPFSPPSLKHDWLTLCFNLFSAWATTKFHVIEFPDLQHVSGTGIQKEVIALNTTARHLRLCIRTGHDHFVSIHKLHVDGTAVPASPNPNPANLRGASAATIGQPQGGHIGSTTTVKSHA